VVIRTCNQYATNVIGKYWKAKKNLDLLTNI